MLTRTPGFTGVAVLALALGIGANTAIFTIVNAALLEGLPFKDPARVVMVWEEFSRRPGRNNSVGPMNFLRWKERATAFEDMAGFVDTRTNLTGSGTPEELTVQNVTAGFFQIVGIPPLVGRGFSDAESVDPNANVVILSHALWQRRFGGDPGIVGRTIQLNANTNTVIGVMPPNVRLQMKSISLVGKPIDLWAPWVLPANARDARGRFMSVIARLRPGTPIEQAQAQMNTIAAALTGGEIEVRGACPEHLESLTHKLREAGVDIEVLGDRLWVRGAGELRPLTVQALPYPGLATDLQALVAVLLTQAHGVSYVHERVFDNRLLYAGELRKMGADVVTTGTTTAIISGPTPLHGTRVQALDVRAGAALILAGLAAASGRTEVVDIYHVDRGYERLDEKLRSLGAKIERV